MRLIDADELKKDLICFYPEGVPSGLDSETMFKQILHDIDNAPTVEPTFGMFRAMLCETCQAYATNRAIAKLADEYTRPHGEWYYNYQNGWHCSECHNSVKNMPTVNGKADFKFCPNCGADMREESEK